MFFLVTMIVLIQLQLFSFQCYKFYNLIKRFCYEDYYYGSMIMKVVALGSWLKNNQYDGTILIIFLISLFQQPTREVWFYKIIAVFLRLVAKLCKPKMLNIFSSEIQKYISRGRMHSVPATKTLAYYLQPNMSSFVEEWKSLCNQSHLHLPIFSKA